MGRRASLCAAVAAFGFAAAGCSVGLGAGLRAARAELDAGRRACAFVRLEHLRRTHLGDPAEIERFQRAFDTVFLGEPPTDASDARERTAENALEAHPADPEAAMALARVRAARGDEAGAKQVLADFAKANPTSTLGIVRALPAEHGAARREALEAAVAAHPDDGPLAFYLAEEIYIPADKSAADDLRRAETLFVHAASLVPKNAAIQAWVGRFFLKKAEPNPTRALDYYYAAYFLDPDFYETEFVEARIGRMLRDEEVAACP